LFQVFPGGDVKPEKVLFKLTPYINVTQDEKDRQLLVCSQCGHVYCELNENFKLYSLVYERDPMEIEPEEAPLDKDWALYREFYCPGCGVQTEVECTPPGAPVWQSYQNISTEI
jgi:acetone carboxylase gamma subunit